MLRLVLFLVLFTLACFAALAHGDAADREPVPLWGRWEGVFTAAGEAPAETELTVELTSPSGARRAVSGFWEGERTWRARFMPGEEGEWRFRTRTSPAVAGLDGQAGTFRCRRAAGEGNRFLAHGPVRISGGVYNLDHEDETRFFWLGDTAWNGALLASDRDWETFLADRKAKKFSAIQFVMTQWRAAPADAEGQVAFTGKEQIRINPRFFQRMDRRFDAVNRHGMLAVPVLLWAIRGEENPGWSLPEDQAIRLARYMIARYGAHHVVWIPAGDGTYTGEFGERWRRICRALFPTRQRAPVVMHPGGMQWPFDAFRDEPWMDLAGYQSGHGDDARTLAWIHSGPASREWRARPRPYLNLEPPYEDLVSYQSKRPHSAYNVRRAAYWSLLSVPTAGLTYGAHGIWSWETEPREPVNHSGTGIAKPWHQAMALPGSTHMKHMAALFGSLQWWDLRPAQDLLEGQPGGADPARFVAIARTEEGDQAVAYLPVGGEVRLKPQLPGEQRAEWFDPRTGTRQKAEPVGPWRYRAPDEQDWVLVLRQG